MINAMIRKSCFPVQMIIDSIRHLRCRRLMMAYALKLNQKPILCAALRGTP